jgi:hypothetical protein
MASLYELTNEYRLAQIKLDESDYDEQTIADTLEGLSGDLNAKANSIACVIRNLEVTAEAIKQAEKEMAERRKTIENKTEAMKLYIKENMQRCGITKIECPYFALTLRKNPPSVVIDDAGAIPNEFYVFPDPPAPYPDKRVIAEQLKSGNVVNGAHLEQAERLEIK